MNDSMSFLVVDKHPDTLNSISRLIRGLGFPHQTEIVESIDGARERMRSTRFDAVILDLDPPASEEVDGVIEFQAAVPEMPVVLLADHEDENTAVRCLHYGAEDFISKASMTRENLCRALRFAIERHRSRFEAREDLSALRFCLDDAMRQANTDTLTGLPNRRGLLRYLDQLGQAPSCSPTVVGLADLDHFKAFNDLHGHHIGDAVLREFAGRLQHCLRKADFAARVGGDEFLVVFPGLSHQECCSLGRRIIEHVASGPVRVSGKEVGFSVTLALAEAGHDELELEKILELTHSMLQKGKGNGRNRLECSWDADEGGRL